MVWPLLHSACRPGTALSWRNCAGVLAAAAAVASQSSVHAHRIGALAGADVYGQRAPAGAERRKADRRVRFTSPPAGVSTWMISALPLRQIERSERPGDHMRHVDHAQSFEWFSHVFNLR